MDLTDLALISGPTNYGNPAFRRRGISSLQRAAVRKSHLDVDHALALLEQAAQAQRARSGQFASGGSRLVGWYMDDHTGVAAPIIKGHDMADGLMAPFGGRAIHIAAAIPGPALRDGSIAPRPPVTDFHNAVKLENRARARSRERGKAFARNGFSLPIPGTMQQAKTAGSIRITSAQLRPSMIPFASLLFADDEFDEGPSYMGFSGHGQHKLEP